MRIELVSFINHLDGELRAVRTNGEPTSTLRATVYARRTRMEVNAHIATSTVGAYDAHLRVIERHLRTLRLMLDMQLPEAVAEIAVQLVDDGTSAEAAIEMAELLAVGKGAR
jgi:hypothetical protein